MNINQDDYAIVENTDVSRAFNAMLSSFSDVDEFKYLSLRKSNYYFSANHLSSREYHISNTIAEAEYTRQKDINKHKFFICIENVKNLTIDGNGSTFIFDGIASNIAILKSKNVVFKNIVFTSKNPNMHTFTVIEKKGKDVEFLLDAESYYIKKGVKFFFLGKGYKESFKNNLYKGWWICKSDATRLVRYHHPFLYSKSIKEQEPYKFKVKFFKNIDYKIGEQFTLFENRRIEQGVLVDHSEDITIDNIQQTFNYGLANIVQNSKNASITNCRFAPLKNSGKAMASVADFIQISMCLGKFNIENNYFEGAGDDVLNIHGFHFKIKKIKDNQIIISHAHCQSYGFCPFQIGEKVAFINRKSLLIEESNVIKEVKMLNKYDILLKLENKINSSKKAVVENMSRAPELRFVNNTIKKIAARGLLVTTRGNVYISENNFISTAMNSILISDDADKWYESSQLQSAVIEKNIFRNCGGYTLQIKPENSKYKGYVHKNIYFMDNDVHSGGFYVKDSDNVIIKNNRLNKNLSNDIFLNSNVVKNDNKHI